MAKYEVVGPDGAKYQIEAENDAAAQEAISSVFGQSQPAAKPMQSAIQKTIGAALTPLKGATLGWADELSAEMAAPLGYVAQKAIGGQATYPETRQKAYEFYNQLYEPQRTFQEQNPLSAFPLEMAGGIASTAGMASAFPNLAKMGAQVATARPYTTAAALGGGTGGLYAAGDAPAGQKVEAGLTGGALGAALGPVMLSGANAVSRMASPLVNRIKQALPSSAPAVTSTTSPQDIANLTQLAQREGGIIPLTAGQRTQQAELQKLERGVLEGVRGTPEATAAMREVRTAQNVSMRDLLKGFGDIDNTPDANVALDSIVNKIKTSAKSEKAMVNSAYDLARQGQGVKIGSEELSAGLMGRIGDLRRTGGYDVNQMPQAKSILDKLRLYSGDVVNPKTKQSRVTSVNLGRLEQIRTQATQAAQRSTDPTEKNFLRGIVRNYDDFMAETAANASSKGDADAIAAFRNAVGLRARYGKMFEGDEIVRSIVEDGKTVDDFASNLFGKGAVSGRSEMAQSLKALIKAGGEQGEAVRTDLKNAFARRILDKSIGGTLEGRPDIDAISPAKLKTQLQMLLEKPEFTKELYGAQALPVLRTAIKDLQLISTTQPATVNTSGTAFAVVDVLKNAGLMRIPGLNVVVNALDNAKQANIAMQEGKQVLSGLTEFTRQPLYQPQSKLFSGNPIGPAVSGGIAAGALTSADR